MTGRCDESGALPSWPALDGDILRVMNEHAMTPEMLQALREAFEAVRASPFTSPPADGEITAEQIAWWVFHVNGGERGTEFRRARSLQLARLNAAGGKPDDPLPGMTFHEFATVFRL